MKTYYIYMLTNELSKPIYIGMTNDLVRRIYEHKQKLANSFSKKYNLTKLIYWEQTEDVKSAIAREKQLKNWHRDWKLNLAKTINTKFKDLSQFANFLDPETSSG